MKQGTFSCSSGPRIFLVNEGKQEESMNNLKYINIAFCRYKKLVIRSTAESPVEMEYNSPRPVQYYYVILLQRKIRKKVFLNI